MTVETDTDREGRREWTDDERIELQARGLLPCEPQRNTGRRLSPIPPLGPERKCANAKCGRTISVYGAPTKLFCSHKCRAAASSRRHRRRRKREPCVHVVFDGRNHTVCGRFVFDKKWHFLASNEQEVTCLQCKAGLERSRR